MNKSKKLKKSKQLIKIMSRVLKFLAWTFLVIIQTTIRSQKYQMMTETRSEWRRNVCLLSTSSCVAENNALMT